MWHKPAASRVRVYPRLAGGEPGRGLRLPLQHARMDIGAEEEGSDDDCVESEENIEVEEEEPAPQHRPPV